MKNIEYLSNTYQDFQPIFIQLRISAYAILIDALSFAWRRRCAFFRHFFKTPNLNECLGSAFLLGKNARKSGDMGRVFGYKR